MFCNDYEQCRNFELLSDKPKMPCLSIDLQSICRVVSFIPIESRGKFSRKNKVKVPEWPGNIPDLIPVENV